MDAMEDDRSSLLDAFARAESRPAATTNLPAAASAPLPDRVSGAQHVAVRRDENRIIDKLRVLANAAGSDWYYRFPVKKKGGGVEYIEGCSIKLANDLARTYGNVEIETRVTDLGDSWLIYARFFDIETGFSMTRPYQQRKSQRGMRTEDDRGLDIAFQIGVSKSIRNVVVNSLQTFADFALEEARNALVEKIGKNLEGYRTRTLDGLAKREIELHRVERTIGRAAKDWTAPDLARVIAMMRSIADGMATVDETFPPIGSESSAASDSEPSGGGEQEEHASRGTDQSAARTSEEQVRAPAAADDQEAEQVAYERGKKARVDGLQRRALPGEYRNPQATKLALAWAKGWDEGAK